MRFHGLGILTVTREADRSSTERIGHILNLTFDFPDSEDVSNGTLTDH